MTCSNTDRSEYLMKLLTRNRRRAARIYDVQARRLAHEVLQGRRKKRPNKAQRILNEAKALHETVREAAGLLAGTNATNSAFPEATPRN